MNALQPASGGTGKLALHKSDHSVGHQQRRQGGALVITEIFPVGGPRQGDTLVTIRYTGTISHPDGVRCGFGFGAERGYIRASLMPNAPNQLTCRSVNVVSPLAVQLHICDMPSSAGIWTVYSR
jgi:hypothetical protein